MKGGLWEDRDKVYICNLSTAGDHTAVSATKTASASNLTYPTIMVKYR